MTNRFDIHIQTLPAAEQRGTFKFMSFGFTSTLGVKGFQMLINQWLKCFLTPRGSDATNLEYGTLFMSMVGSNTPLIDARDIVLIAIDSCNGQIGAIQQTDVTLTPSERLAEAKLVDFVEDLSAPGFNAYVEIRNQARERLVLNIPTSANV